VGLLEFGLSFTDLLHLKHSLHDKLILTLLINMALALTLPWKKELGVPTLVEWDQQNGRIGLYME
jgi:hypothetical protein